MRSERLFDAITEVKDELVNEAGEIKPSKKRVHWLRWGSLAAVLVLVSGVAAGMIPILPIGGNTGNEGHDGGATFMSYAGPVFPLTALSGAEGLAASRDVTYDFSTWTPVWKSVEEMADESLRNGSLSSREELLESYQKTWPKGGYYVRPLEVQVTDAYTLTNPTGQDRTVKLLYPFVSSFMQLNKDCPTLTADGAELATQLHAGVYSGGFQGAIGGEDQEMGSVNLKGAGSWESYKALMTGGSYQTQALGEFPDLSGIPVTVYEFTDAWGPEGEDANTHIHVGFSMDYDKTKVLAYGFTGGCYYPSERTMDRSFPIPQSFWPEADDSKFIIVAGEPVTDWQVFACSTGEPDGKADLEFGVEAGVTVTQYDTDLDSALRMAAELTYNSRGGSGQDFELYFGLMKLDMTAYGIMSSAVAERYADGELEALDFAGVERVFYLESTVTVPAGGSIVVEAGFLKRPSMDYTCTKSKHEGIYGYDMVTRLGTNLDIRSQTATAVNTQYAQIVWQNYGFDWDNGVNTVTLDPEVEHYYMEVRRVKRN